MIMAGIVGAEKEMILQVEAECLIAPYAVI